MVKQPNDGLQGLVPPEQRPAFGKMPNAQHQKHYGFLSGAPYSLAIIEFDDQGRCYDRGQMDGIAHALDDLRAKEKDVILLVFTHGWKHDARSDDENLSAFRMLLAKTVEHERENAAASGTERPVLGVFVAWRGLSEYGVGEAATNLTFWGRQAAGSRVATGSVRELFGRMRHYRNHRLDKKGSPLLVIAGHSFGGMIVFSAIAQSLIEAASAPAGDVVPSFADLVLLINPAIEGARYIPIQDLVCSPAFKARTTEQLPVFICAQAENDQPVGTWFPTGNFTHSLEQATIGDLEKECVTHAIGFVPTFKTHHLTGPQGAEPFELDPPGSAQINPFWVVTAEKAVIDGHGGFWQEPFLQFLASIVFQHVRGSKDARRVAPTSAPHPSGGASSGDLAAFAKMVGPIKLPT